MRRSFPCWRTMKSREEQRRQRMRRWAALSLPEVLAAIEEMGQVAERLSGRTTDPPRPGIAADRPVIVADRQDPEPRSRG